MNKFQNQNFADSSQMVLDAFQQIPMDELRSGIYVLFGAYMEVESGRLHIVPDPRWADWLLYYSIETDLEGKFVLPEKQVSFESTHPVIHKSLAKTKKELNRQYNQIRYLYFKSLLECDDYELEKENLVKKVQEEYDCLEKVTLVKKYTQK